MYVCACICMYKEMKRKIFANKVTDLRSFIFIREDQIFRETVTTVTTVTTRKKIYM